MGVTNLRGSGVANWLVKMLMDKSLIAADKCSCGSQAVYGLKTRDIPSSEPVDCEFTTVACWCGVMFGVWWGRCWCVFGGNGDTWIVMMSVISIVICSSIGIVISVV